MNAIHTYKILLEYLSKERQVLFNNVLEERTRYLTVVLEDLNQAHNISAVMRSCDCFGLQDLHIIENSNQFEIKPRIARGSGKWLTIKRYRNRENNTLEAVNTLKDRGYRIVATTSSSSALTPSNISLDQPIALIMGTEWNGISDEASSLADDFLHLPMRGFTESYNVSVATALIINHLSDRIRTELSTWRLSSEEKDQLKAEWATSSVKGAAEILKRALEEHT